MIKNLALKIRDFLLVHCIQLSILGIVIGLVNDKLLAPFLMSGIFVGLNFLLLSASVFLVTEVKKTGAGTKFLLISAALFKYVFLGVGGYYIITHYKPQILWVIFGFSTILVTIFATSLMRIVGGLNNRMVATKEG